jgi:hypothetical protein
MLGTSSFPEMKGDAVYIRTTTKYTNAIIKLEQFAGFPEIRGPI